MPRRTIILLALATAAGFAQPANRLPAFGDQSPDNSYRGRLVLMKTIDFEQPQDYVVIQPNVSITTDSAEVIGGLHSLKLSGPEATFVLRPETLALQPSKIYVVEYDYRIVSRTSKLGAVSVFFAQNPVLDLGGPTMGAPESGTDRRAVRIGSDWGATIGMHSFQSVVLIDNIRIYRQDADVLNSQIRLWDVGFPRLGAYSLTTPEATAFRNGVSLPDVTKTLAGYDLLTGIDSDPTTGVGNWVNLLRGLNPKMRILPYQESFVSQLLDSQPLGDSAGLNALFNQGLAPEWFMVDASGNRLNEPAYPQNFQMDHTVFCPPVNGQTYNQYKFDYLAKSILPSGLWDGLHLDQPEWYTNPLLEGSGGTFPPIDLKRTGKSSSASELYQAWQDAFFAFMPALADRLGPGQILFGNAGYVPANRKILSTLNGWLREVVTPYNILPNGDWATGDAAGWYRLTDRYFSGLTSVRAPSVMFMEFMGQGLGQIASGSTANGYSIRVPTLEPRDFRRMRLGLATTLLGDGLFGYDLVDNTSPPQWFDEYAVDRNGSATRDLSGKGYLGQPLGPGVELPYASRIVLSLDFESGSLPGGFKLGSGAHISTKNGEVIDGNGSLVLTRDGSTTDAIMFSTDPALVPLSVGKTYQLIADYRILDYTPSTFQGIGGIGISSSQDGLTTYRTASLYQPDMDGPGQQGVFRSSVKVTGAGFSAMGALTDTGSLSIDNLKLIEGTGGVWRRDFESGIVLVNPTPEPIAVPLADIQGTLGRTGIHRIRGTQVPGWNDGSAVTGPLTIPPADGIVLLADATKGQSMAAPDGVTADAANGTVRLNWKPASGYVAGYHVLYGEDPDAPVHEFATGSTGTALPRTDPGTTLYARVAAFDFLGNKGPYSKPVAVAVPGAATLRPSFALADGFVSIAPGALTSLTGSGFGDDSLTADGPPYPTRLGQTSVLVNGTPAPIVTSAPDGITFIVPWEIAGPQARLTVVTGGVRSADRLVDVVSALPSFPQSGDAGQIFAYHADSSPIGESSPVQPGEAITVWLRGLGRVEPPAANGQLPTLRSIPTGAVSVSLAGQTASEVSATLATGYVGLYGVTFQAPAGIAGGMQTLTIGVAGSPAVATAQLPIANPPIANP